MTYAGTQWTIPLFTFYFGLLTYMNLTGKTILVTRSAHQADDFVHLIEQYGGRAIVFSTLEIVPPGSWADCDRAIKSLSLYDGLIFTSTNGVEFFFRRLKERGGPLQELHSKMILVVGEKRRRAWRNSD